MKKPSFLDMIKNFASEVTEYAKKGAPNVTESEYAERVQECDACPHLDLSLIHISEPTRP